MEINLIGVSLVWLKNCPGTGVHILGLVVPHEQDSWVGWHCVHCIEETTTHIPSCVSSLLRPLCQLVFGFGGWPDGKMVHHYEPFCACNYVLLLCTSDSKGFCHTEGLCYDNYILAGKWTSKAFRTITLNDGMLIRETTPLPDHSNGNRRHGKSTCLPYQETWGRLRA